MGILIDGILIAIVALNVIIGYKKGLINVAFNILAFLIAILLTLVLFKPISNIVIENTEIDDKIRETIINNISNEENENIEEKKNSGWQNYIETKIKEETNKAKNEATEAIAQNVSIRATEIITSIVLFIVLRIILILLRFIGEALGKLPIIKQFNELGGIIYGILKAAIIILLLLTVLYFVVSMNPNGIIATSIEDTHITKFLYQNNIIINYCLLGKNLL